MHSVIFSLSIAIATINVMQRSMSGVLMTQAISLRSRMRGNLSRPVLKAGRRERSLLPSYQNKLHYRRDGSLGEDACQTRTGPVPSLLSQLNSTALSLMDRLGVRNVARQMRYFDAHPEQALALLLSGSCSVY